MTRVVARKRFGQHFLSDPFVLAQISAAINLQPGERLFEIGPGRGALTSELYSQLVTYRAVEIDRDLIDPLQQRFPDLQLISADILAVPLAEALADGPWRVVGNLPYNISSPLLGKLFEHMGDIVDIHVMLQKEVAQRLGAPHGSKSYGRLSVAAQIRMDIEVLFDVPPESFTPPPAVNSAVVRMAPGDAQAQLPPLCLAALDQILRLAFQQRRKRIANALKSLALDFSALPIDPDQRADQIGVVEYAELARWLVREREDLLS